MAFEPSNPYEVVVATNVVIRLSREQAVFELLATDGKNNSWFVRGYDDRVQYCRDEVTYELMRDQPDFWSRCIAEHPLGLEFSPADFTVLKQWVGPPRQADLAKCIGELVPAQLAFAGFSAAVSFAAYASGDHVEACIAAAFMVWNLLEIGVGWLRPRPTLFFWRMVIWSAFGFEAVRRSLSTGEFELGLLVLSVVMLFISSKKYVTYRDVVPEQRWGSHDAD